MVQEEEEEEEEDEDEKCRFVHIFHLMGGIYNKNKRKVLVVKTFGWKTFGR